MIVLGYHWLTCYNPFVKTVSDPTKVKIVGIGQEKTSGANVKERLSKRAVVKEERLGKVSLQQRR